MLLDLYLICGCLWAAGLCGFRARKGYWPWSYFRRPRQWVSREAELLAIGGAFEDPHAPRG